MKVDLTTFESVRCSKSSWASGGRANTYRVHGPEDFQVDTEIVNGEHVIKIPPAWKWDHPQFPRAPLTTKHWANWLVAIETLRDIVGWVEM